MKNFRHLFFNQLRWRRLAYTHHPVVQCRCPKHVFIRIFGIDDILNNSENSDDDDRKVIKSFSANFHFFFCYTVCLYVYGKKTKENALYVIDMIYVQKLLNYPRIDSNALYTCPCSRSTTLRA